METIKNEKEFHERSLAFMKKLYLIVKAIGYDSVDIDDCDLTTIIKIVASDAELLKSETEASTLLFNNYSDDDIIAVMKPLIEQNTIFSINNKNYRELLDSEIAVRKQLIKFLDSETPQDSVMKYNMDIFKYCPATVTLLMLFTFKEFEEKNII